MNEYLYLVIVPYGPLLEQARRLQEQLNMKFYLYQENLPPLHITVDAFYGENTKQLQQAVDLLKLLCAEVKPFTIEADGFSAFSYPYKTINVHINKSPALKHFHQLIHDGLLTAGVETRSITPDEVIFHMTLVGATSGRNWSGREFMQAWRWIRDKSFYHTLEVRSLELWYPQFQPELKVAARFDLAKD